MSIAKGLAETRSAVHFTKDAMAVFHAACQKRDWEAARKARDDIVAATESYLDQFMAAQRAIQETEKFE